MDMPAAEAMRCAWVRGQAAFYVEYREGNWRVREGHGVRGTYRNKASAITAAVAMAHDAGRDGKAAQVLCLSRTREWMPLWTYELDGDRPVAMKA